MVLRYGLGRLEKDGECFGKGRKIKSEVAGGLGSMGSSSWSKLS